MSNQMTANESTVFGLIAADGEMSSIDAICESTGKSVKSINMTINSLIKKGFLTKEGDSIMANVDGENAMEDDMKNAVAEGMDEAIAADDAPKKKKKAKKKDKDQEEATPTSDEEAEATESKPEPITYKGFQVKDEEKAKALEEEEAKAAEAFESLKAKEKTGLNEYLSIGRFQYEVRQWFASKQVFGQYLKEALPVSQELDAPLRSNSTWLYGAVHDPAHEAYDDLFTVLELDLEGRNDPDARPEVLASYKSANPTVIKRNYSKAKKAAKEAEEAREAGYESEDDEKAIKAKKKAEQEAEKERIERVVKGYVSTFKLSKKKTDELEQTLRYALSNKSDAIDHMESLLPE